MQTLTPKLRKGLPPLPKGVRKLPLDPRGYPIPWFVDQTGVIDFRIVDERKRRQAIHQSLCWVCGGPLDRMFAFVIGPMCAVNRISSEPPSHVSCAEFSARACPFLSKPSAKRREGGMPEEATPPPGVAIMRNPGVALVWVTDSYEIRRVGDGVLLKIGNPRGVLWFCEARQATRVEVLKGIETGLPQLMDSAKLQGPDAVAALERALERAMKLVPK